MFFVFIILSDKDYFNDHKRLKYNSSKKNFYSFKIFSNFKKMASHLQYDMINLIKNLIRFERNQQIMSNAHFINDILITCKYVLMDETHFLNASIQHIFERLATQSITPKSLREYLRLGTIFDASMSPTLTASLLNSPNNSTSNILMPLNRVKCLISMTTPRENKFHTGTAFVEFNMFVEGFGCLFLPSIAPQLTNAPSIVAMGMVSVGNDLSVNGGIGTGERVFPPQSGLTFSTWIYIDKFGTPHTSLTQPSQLPSQDSTASSSASTASKKQAHPIRILTLIKHSKVKDTLTACLTVYLSARSRSLFVSTEETLLQNQCQQQQKYDELAQDNNNTSNKTQRQQSRLNDYTVKFNCGELFQEGKWLHIGLVWSRAVLKNSSVTLYVNSVLIGSQRLHYIASGLAANQTPASTSIHAVIGTLPMFRLQLPLVWRQGCCYLFEDVLPHSTIASLYQLGPNYLGSFQSPPPTQAVRNHSIFFKLRTQ